jgi:hypothetical protein
MNQAKVLWEVNVRGITDNTLLRWMEQHIQASGPVMDFHFRQFLSGLCVTKGLGTARLHNFLTAPILPSLYLFPAHRQTFPIPTFMTPTPMAAAWSMSRTKLHPSHSFRVTLTRHCHSNLSMKTVGLAPTRILRLRAFLCRLGFKERRGMARLCHRPRVSLGPSVNPIRFNPTTCLIPIVISPTAAAFICGILGLYPGQGHKTRDLLRFRTHRDREDPTCKCISMAYVFAAV